MNDTSLLMLRRMLDTATLRHKVIANNMANVNTPGYQRRVVQFDEQLAKAIAAGDAKGIAASRLEVVKSDDPALRPDGNNVSLERELVDLMRNSLLHNTCTQLIATRLASYRAAITGDTRAS